MIVGLLAQCPYWVLRRCLFGKTLYANFLTGSLFGVESKHRFLFHNGIYRRKKIKKPNKKLADGPAGISESGPG